MPSELFRGHMLHEELVDPALEKAFLVFQKTYCIELLKTTYWMVLAGVAVLTFPKVYMAWVTFQRIEQLVCMCIYVCMCVCVSVCVCIYIYIYI